MYLTILQILLLGVLQGFIAVFIMIVLGKWGFLDFLCGKFSLNLCYFCVCFWICLFATVIMKLTMDIPLYYFLSPVVGSVIASRNLN